MSISIEQAFAELAALQANNAATEDALSALARQISVEANGAITVLYSGKLPDGASSSQAVQALVNAGQDIRVIDETAAARFLKSEQFNAAFARASGMSPAQLDDPSFAHPAKDRLFDARNGPWADVSKRFAEATVGEVRVIAHNASPDRIFAATELPALLRSNAVTSIEGVPLSELKAVETASGAGEAFKRVRLVSEWNIAASGMTSNSPLAFLDSALFDKKAYLESHPGAHGRLDDYYSGRQANALNAADIADRRTTSEAMRRIGEGTRLSGTSRVLNRLGMLGAVAGFGFAASDANAAHNAGDTQRAKEIMKEWAVDAAGSEIGSMVGAAVGGIAVAVAAVAGVTIGAPLAAAVVLGSALIGGIFGAEGATELYHLLDDRDANGRRDVIDRLSNLLFGATSTLTTPLPADLNGARFTIDASLTRDEIVANARTSAAWRYALRELNSFVITDVSYERHNTDGSLDLYDETTGNGAMSERFLQDRAAMLAWKLQFERDGARDADDGVRTGPKPFNEDWDTDQIQGNWDFVDLSVRLPGGQPLTLAIDGAGLSLHDHQVVFGSLQADTIEGEGDSDWLYGMAGNDTLRGKEGADYLEGNADDDSLQGGEGNDTLGGGAGIDTLEGGTGSDALYGGADYDTYRFSGVWGSDTIRDSGHDGTITIEGLGTLSGAGAKLIADNVWRTDDQRVSYAYVSADDGQKGYLVISVTGDASGNHRGNIRIDDWSPGQLGITLGNQAAPAPSARNYDGDLIKQVNAAQTSYVFAPNGGYVNFQNYASAGAQADAADVINGSNDADLIRGFGGHDGLAGGDGDDTIEGGAGNDLIKGGTGADSLLGGEGNDVILGSALDDVRAPSTVGQEREPVPSGREAFTQGFSWSALRTPGPRIAADNTLSFKVNGVAGAFTGVAWQDGGWYVESDGNFIDGGAGDDYIGAGTAADIAHGGEGDDDLFGQDDADVLFGDAGVKHHQLQGTRAMNDVNWRIAA